MTRNPNMSYLITPTSIKKEINKKRVCKHVNWFLKMKTQNIFYQQDIQFFNFSFFHFLFLKTN
ncbi:hypothetical protein M0813_08453 [Anaeramoeba flamelloides]|uniref:Uncharacterized protein n=1 Tax=Anaeramoeba flamelloides TaxID=1746091 RepID=A0ABQ8X8U7_9EUKA|nr:hypothetical protein M0813_08453 [Anaeramoeba flamelloides]